jgi:DNA-binding LytR/AlgR family response regulator
MLPSSDHQICLATFKGSRVFKYDEIVYFEIEDGMIHVKLLTKQSVSIKNSLKELENGLISCLFYRIHAKYLINMNCISEYLHKSRELIMKDNITLKVAKDRRAAFKKAFDELFSLEQPD